MECEENMVTEVVTNGDEDDSAAINLDPIADADDTMVTESIATENVALEAVVVSENAATNNNEQDEVQEQPAAITTAITTIISHFVISADGLTKNRIEVLQKLLNELSTCDEEAKTSVEALQQILSELQPQGSTVDLIPTLVYDPSSKKTDDSSTETFEAVAISSNCSIEPMEIQVSTQIDRVNARNEIMHAMSEVRGKDYSKAMKDILKSQRTQQNVENQKASTYDLCLWCNKLVVSGKTKDHAMIKHRAISFHENFICPFCSKTFNSNATVIEHLRFIPLCSKSETDSPMTCSLCLDNFVGAGTLREHYIIFHNIGISNDSHSERRAFWSCLYCGIAEHSKGGLSKHIKTYHHSVSPHFCRFCGIKYFSLLGLHKHLIIQHRIGLGDTLYDYYSLVCDFKFQLETTVGQKTCCTYCDEEINDSAEFETHVQEVHYCTDGKCYLCSFCNLTYQNKETLEKHVFNGHLLGGLGFSFNLPRADFSVPASVSTEAISNTDMEEIEGIDTGEVTLPQNITFFLCPICKETAHNLDHFREHSGEEILKVAIDHIELNQDWIVSDKCSILRNMISTLMIPTGTGAPEVICNLCKKLLPSKEMFNFHFMDKHLKKIKVQCLDCHKFFRDRISLNMHITRAHGPLNGALMGPTTPSKPRYVIKSMKQHRGPNNIPIELVVPDAEKVVDIRPDEAPKKTGTKTKDQSKMSCTLCSYTCYRIDHLEEHIQAKHYKNSVNQCTMCNSRYSRRRDLRRHYINKHHLPQAVAREMTELTTPTEPWRAKLEVRRGRRSRKTPGVFDTGEVVNVSSNVAKNDSSNDNLCDINPDILDISLVGNLDND